MAISKSKKCFKIFFLSMGLVSRPHSPGDWFQKKDWLDLGLTGAKSKVMCIFILIIKEYEKTLLSLTQ